MNVRTILLVTSAVCPLIMLAASCGGGDSGDLFGNTGSSSGSGQASGTTTTGASSGTGQGGATTTTTSAQNSSSVGSGGAGGVAGGPGVGGAGGGIGGSGGSAGPGGGQGGGSQQSSSSMSSSGTGGGGPTVYCNDQLCMTTDICCWSQFGGQSNCSAAGTSCGMGYAPLSCNDIEDCAPGEMCCGTFNQMFQTYTNVQCQASCNTGQYIMCYGHPELCPAGQSCLQSSYLGTGYMYCG